MNVFGEKVALSYKPITINKVFGLVCGAFTVYPPMYTNTVCHNYCTVVIKNLIIVTLFQMLLLDHCYCNSIIKLLCPMCNNYAHPALKLEVSNNVSCKH